MAEKTHFEIHDTCATCKYHDTLTDVVSHQQTALCRLNPPKTFAQAIPVPNPKGPIPNINWNYSSMWTMVKDTDWCSHYTRKLHS